MNNKTNYNWTQFYIEFANELLLYKNKRTKLIHLLTQIYQELNFYYPLIDGNKIGQDVCPFSVMGLFNRQISNENRIRILSKIKEKFDIASEIPDAFEGIPLLNNQKSMFYAFSDQRNENDISNLWDLFEVAIHYADHPNDENYQRFCHIFNLVQDQSCVQWNITIGLFWIRPYTFISLDKNTKNFLLSEKNKEFQKIKEISPLKKVPNGEEYIKIIKECQRVFKKRNAICKNFIELSDYAYENSISKASFLKWFKPILEALKELGGKASASDVRNKIIEMEHLPLEVTTAVRGKTRVNKFSNEVSFARNYLVFEELIDGSERGIWKLTDKGRNIVMTKKEASHIFSKWVDIMKHKRENKLNYWLVGADWQSVGNQTKRFIEQGIWENGYDNKYSNIVNKIMPGDKIAIKSSYTKINDIPFNNNGKNVSVMKIKVTGTVTENLKNGKIIQVDWDTEDGREWYMFTGRSTIWNITPKDKTTDWMKERLVKFVFENQKQDYQEFLNDPKWSDKYNTSSEDTDKEKNLIKYNSYTKDDFLKEVFITEDEYDILKNTLLRKKSLILHGAPGVGKTFCAKKLMHSILGKVDTQNIKVVQFHQSYSYEDFIQGFRPNTKGHFELKNGIFYDLVMKANYEYELAQKENRKAENFCIIIDEINRGNLCNIFGELLMLIETDKRGNNWAVHLTYSDKEFYLPENLYIIGTMNTTDRSLSKIDYALKRRFSHIPLKPAFENQKLTDYLVKDEGIDNEFAEKITDKFIKLNTYITETLNENFVIGHSYFIHQLDSERLEESYTEIIQYDIKPLLEDYYWSDKQKVEEALNIIRL